MITEISLKQLQQIRGDVSDLLHHDDSGHDIAHIDRVVGLVKSFCSHLSGANCALAEVIALLHDVDDYKLVGKEKADRLENASRIMNGVGLPNTLQQQIKEAISSIGYSKSLRGIRPSTLEGQIVSDADMCDAIGANGVIRCLQYAVSTKGSGVIFDPVAWPDADMTAEKYNKHGTITDNDSFINHFFDKLLKLKGMMLTEPGRREAETRDDMMVGFLRQYFREQQEPEWSGFLEKYLVTR